MASRDGMVGDADDGEGRDNFSKRSGPIPAFPQGSGERGGGVVGVPAPPTDLAWKHAMNNNLHIVLYIVRAPRKQQHRSRATQQHAHRRRPRNGQAIDGERAKRPSSPSQSRFSHHRRPSPVGRHCARSRSRAPAPASAHLLSRLQAPARPDDERAPPLPQACCAALTDPPTHPPHRSPARRCGCQMPDARC